MITDGLTINDLALIEMDLQTLKKRHDNISSELHDLRQLIDMINEDPCFLSSNTGKMLNSYLQSWNLNHE